jgi:hypothetical protein
MSMRAFKIVAIVMAIVFSLPFLVYGYVLVSWNGGFANTIRILTPRPNLELASIKADREKLDARIGAGLEAIVVASGFKLYASATDDRCYDGENNWKRSDGYAHRCSLRRTRLLGFDSDFRQTMLDFEKSLLTSGWAPAGRNMDYEMAEYYDRRRSMLSDRLPLQGYRMAGLVLEISWTEGSSQPLQHPEDHRKRGAAFDAFWAERNASRFRKLDANQRIRAGSHVFYERSEYMNTVEAFNSANLAVRYMLFVSVQGDYFEN